MAKTALVTGGAGFIGGHLTELLVRSGWTVRVMDNLHSGRIENLASVASEVEFSGEDIRDAEACRRACQGADVVFHLAALASVAGSVADPATSHAVNVGGTLNMLLAARDAGVRRFVFSSSAAVYGTTESIPTGEEEPLAPQSPYGTDKAAGEMYCRNFFEIYGLETVILRYFNVFGPRQNVNGGYAAVIPAFITTATRGERPVVFGDGRQTRDFVYVENVAAANLLAGTASAAAGGTFNIGSGCRSSLLSLIEVLSELTGRPLHPDFREERVGEVRHSVADIRRAAEVLGYVPRISLACGLERTLDAYRLPEQIDRLSAVA